MPKWLSSIVLAAMALSFASAAHADLGEIDQQCRKMYKVKRTRKKLDALCFCITSNLEKSLKPAQIAELTETYNSAQAKVAMIKDPRRKVIMDLDFEAHTQCQKNSGWKRAADDLGTPDPT